MKPQRYRPLFIIISLLALCFSLLGCLSVKTPTSPQTRYRVESPQTRLSQLAAVIHWQAQGAFSITGRQKQSIIAGFSWKQINRDTAYIRLFSSLNLFDLTLAIQPSEVTLQRGNQQPIHAVTPEKLLQKTLNWTLPITPLKQWIKGTPAKGTTLARFDHYGHLIYLQQRGWTITFQQYRTVHHTDFPTVLYLTRPGINVKIVVTRWTWSKSK